MADEYRSLTRTEKRIIQMWEGLIQQKRPLGTRLLVLTILSGTTYGLIALLYKYDELFFPICMTPASILLATYGGWGLGTLFSVLTALAIDYFLIPPIGAILTTQLEKVTFALVTAIGVLMGAFVASLRFTLTKMNQLKVESQQTQEKLERAVQARDEMIGVISHELKNPLTALQTGLTLIERESPENQRVIYLLEILKPSISRMTHLISDLLDLTKIEANALKVELTSAHLSVIVQDAVQSQRFQVEEKHLRLTLEMAPDLPEVRCDPSRTHQIITNLISNAIKFTPPHGSVKIMARGIDLFIEVRISDTGKGIPKEHIPFLFNRFWQAEDTLRQGTGLGLTIAKGLIEAQGGKIWAESTVGMGSTFYFTIPLARASSPSLPKGENRSLTDIPRKP